MNNLNNKKRVSKNRGFTIVETLVAIFILLVSVTGPLAIAQNGLRAAFLARDQVTATFLAQDVIEYVKNVRDDNFLTNLSSGGVTVNWLEGLGDCISSSGCSIDTTITSSNINTCSIPSITGCSLEEGPLKIDSDNEFGFSGTKNSKYSRVIQIVENDDEKEAEITVTIEWQTHALLGNRTIVVREYITNWLNL